MTAQWFRYSSQCRESAKKIENMLLKPLRDKLSKGNPGSRDLAKAFGK